MVKFYLLTGFLGSGKTTLLKNILKEIGGTKRIAVIQNEFAPTGIDGKELQLIDNSFKLVEINNGSVFCVCQLSNFIETFHKIIESYHPDIIFLETSGLADPISISELLMHPSLKNKLQFEKIITVVDALNFEKGLNMMPRVRHQLMVSDTILLNKTDLVAKSINKIENQVLEIAPFAQILRVNYCNTEIHDLLTPIEDKANYKKYQNRKSGGRPEEVQPLVLRTGMKISIEKLKRIVLILKEKSVRSKGFVNLDTGKSVLYHTVFEEESCTEVTNYCGQTEVIVFSTSMTLSELRNLFKN